MVLDKTLNSIISGLALEFKLDKRVVKEAAFHPLLFYKRKIESGDNRPMRLMYFGAFVPKTGRVNKMDAMNYIGNRLLDNIDEVWEALPEKYYDTYKSLKDFKDAVKVALAEENKQFLDKLYKIYKEHLKNV